MYIQYLFLFSNAELKTQEIVISSYVKDVNEFDNIISLKT